MNVLDLSKTSANIKKIGADRKKLSDLIQETAVAVVFHSHTTGDYTLGNDLCRAVGNGMKHEALRLWLIKYGPLQLPNKEQKAEGRILSWAAAKRVTNPEQLAAVIEKARAEPWYATPTETKAEVWAFEGDFAKLMRKLEKSISDGSIELTDKNRSLVESLRKVRDEHAKTEA